MSKIKSMIRVNHAGEYGATRIYAGQLAVLKGTGSEETLTEMASQEADHLKKFNRLIIEHEVQPTVLQPLWHIGGYALGMLTALLGEKAAHACTIAVEEVIDEHYQDQLENLQEMGVTSDPTSPHSTLHDLIEQCRQEEVAHKEIAIDMGGREAPAYSFLSATIKTISRTAIWLSSRI
ncbi:MAG: demethoxyubiquinone hydroxylase family protein [Alphaproteobacteria bacterium]|nr:demethoxyubiquinone hydroxylase family protein [Alphaproteobacteria bacterium]